MDQKSISDRFSYESEATQEAVIRVVGVGGGGGNALNNMIKKGIKGVEFVAINTDAQALFANEATTKIQAGKGLTKGLGAGARAEVGANAIEESHSEIEQSLKGCDMLFITAGMGGGTGTGGAPIVAKIAQKMGILTVGIVTKPFDCEGRKRMQAALKGIEELRQYVDTIIVIPNERLLDIAESNTTILEAFAMADEVLFNATKGISDLITVNGLVNLDFADVRTTMERGGTALMGAATATGDKRAEKAAQEALNSPLLDGISIDGATNVLVNITAGKNFGIREATVATQIVQDAAGEEVEVIFGTVINEDMGENLRVTVIATGFDKPRTKEEVPQKVVHVTQPSPVYEEVLVEEPASHVDEDIFDMLYDNDASNEDKKVFRLTTKKDQNSPLLYKGENNIKGLDEPAFERRTIEPRQPKETRQPTIKHLSADKQERRKDKDGHNRPSFLRNIMD